MTCRRACISAIAALQARPVVAGKDFTWQVEKPPGQAPEGRALRRDCGGARWSYNGLRLSLRNLPPSALAGSIQYRNAATALAADSEAELGDAGMRDSR